MRCSESTQTIDGSRWTKRERELAIEKGCYHEGVTAVTVIVDRGWSMRSHKHCG